MEICRARLAADDTIAARLRSFDRSRSGDRGPASGTGGRAGGRVSRQGGVPLQIRQLHRVAERKLRARGQPGGDRRDGRRCAGRRAGADRRRPQRQRAAGTRAQAPAGRPDRGPARPFRRPGRQRPPGRNPGSGQGPGLAHGHRGGRRARAGQHDQFRGGRGQGPFRHRASPVRIEQPENQCAPARSRAQSRVEIVVKLPSPRSLRQKLLGMVLVTTLVALIVALAAIVGYDLSAYHRILVSDMTTQAELLGRTIAPALALEDVKVAKENLGLLRFRPLVSSAAIYNARGGLFATYARADDPRGFPKLPEPDSARVEERELVAFKRIVSDGEILGTVFLRADYELFDRVYDYLGIAAVVLIAAMLVALLMSSWMQNIVTRPILAIAQIAREVVEQRDYSRRAPKMSADEVGTLVDSFNDMLTEIDRRTRELEASNAKLAQEAEERSRAEREVMRLNAELENRVRDRTAQLETANRELESFSYSVSHDLRAPLRAIDGFGQALVDDFPEHLPGEAKRYLSRIRASTQHMAQLIEDLLKLARVSRGSLERRAVDLGQIARQVVAELQQGEPGRAVEVSIWDGMRAEGDPHLLRAALENLIGNAWKFTSKSAEPRIEIGALKDRGRTTYFVRDNGAGFEMAYADKLFGAFQRLHSTNEYSGTGIGLATVQRIVHRHGGRVWAEAEVGKGAVFFFTLEAAAEKAEEAVGKKAHG